jgi:hypothetical protein
MSSYHQATDDLLCDADRVREWIDTWGGLEDDRTAALVRILTTGSARALLRDQEALVKLFERDYAEEINELADRLARIPSERAQDLRDELAGFRT